LAAVAWSSTNSNVLYSFVVVTVVRFDLDVSKNSLLLSKEVISVRRVKGKKALGLYVLSPVSSTKKGCTVSWMLALGSAVA
jgi:hypothetical protein